MIWVKILLLAPLWGGINFTPQGFDKSITECNAYSVVFIDEVPKQKNAKKKNKKPSALPAKQSKEAKHDKETEKPKENTFSVNDNKQVR